MARGQSTGATQSESGAPGAAAQNRALVLVERLGHLRRLAGLIHAALEELELRRAEHRRDGSAAGGTAPRAWTRAGATERRNRRRTRRAATPGTARGGLDMDRGPLAGLRGGTTATDRLVGLLDRLPPPAGVTREDSCAVLLVTVDLVAHVITRAGHGHAAAAHWARRPARPAPGGGEPEVMLLAMAPACSAASSATAITGRYCMKRLVANSMIPANEVRGSVGG